MERKENTAEAVNQPLFVNLKEDTPCKSFSIHFFVYS